MKRILCCLGGGNASKVVQEPTEPPEPPQQPQLQQQPEPSEPSDSSESNDDEGDELNDEAPFGNNDLLNNARRNIIDLSDDCESSDSSSNPHPSSPPLLARSGVAFQWREIVDGTKNFWMAHFLGQGDFGEVYRCNLPRTDKVGAAKIQDTYKPSGHPQFVAEITSLHAASHPNVIRLLGKCFGHKNRAIVYEFMPNGSLDHHLFANVRPGPGLPQETRVLNWDTRMRIALGVAEGLVYLHQRLNTIHRDVKVANILLDKNFVPKLSDFGLATKMVKDEDGVERQIKINPIKKTQECIPPEAEFGLVSTKSDVYSYGVFLLQLFTGRKAYDEARPAATRNITDWLMPVWSREEYAPLVVDVAFGKKFSVQGLNRLFFTARMCIDAQALSRPDMEFVETMVRQASAYPVPECLPVKQRFSI